MSCEDWEQRHPDAGGEPADAKGARRLRVGIEVESCGIDGGEDRHRVIGQSATCGSESHASTLGLDQRRSGLLGERSDLLGHRRGGEVMGFGDRAHGSQPGQCEQQLQPAGVHEAIVRPVRRFGNDRTSGALRPHGIR